MAKLNIWNTARLYLRRSKGCSLRLTCFRDVHLLIEKGASIVGSGKLDLGKPWKGARLFPSEFRLYKFSELRVGGSFFFVSGCSIVVRENAVLRLGSGFVNSGARIDCYSGISIGDRVMIGPDVIIMDSDGHQLVSGGPVTAPVTINDRVWIGARVTILKGVEIGEGSVVAAGSVVAKSVPPYSLVAGVPSRVIRSDIRWGS